MNEEQVLRETLAKARDLCMEMAVQARIDADRALHEAERLLKEKELEEMEAKRKARCRVQV